QIWAARRQGAAGNAHQARRNAARSCAGRDDRWVVLERQRRYRGHARGVRRGPQLMARTLINVPPKAKRGDLVEGKALIAPPMESGFRVGPSGQPIPRDIITLSTCTYNGTEVFRAELSPAIAANPFISFFTVAMESGRLEFRWTGDNGFDATASADIIVE